MQGAAIARRATALMASDYEKPAAEPMPCAAAALRRRWLARRATGAQGSHVLTRCSTPTRSRSCRVRRPVPRASAWRSSCWETSAERRREQPPRPGGGSDGAGGAERIRVRVRLFAVLRERAGADRSSCALPRGASVAERIRALSERPRWRAAGPSAGEDRRQPRLRRAADRAAGRRRARPDPSSERRLGEHAGRARMFVSGRSLRRSTGSPPPCATAARGRS